MFVGTNSRKHKFLPPRIEVDLVIKVDGHRGTTDEFATIPFHLVLFSAALVELTNFISAHSLILSSTSSYACLFFFLLLSPVGLSFPLLDQDQEFIVFSNGCLDLSANLLIGSMVLVRNVK